MNKRTERAISWLREVVDDLDQVEYDLHYLSDYIGDSTLEGISVEVKLMADKVSMKVDVLVGSLSGEG